MNEWLVNLAAIILVIPYTLTVLLFVLFKILGRTSVRSFRIAADSTVPFLFVSVGMLVSVLVPVRANIILTSAVFCIAIGFTIIERVRSKEFRMKVLFRNLWRMFFLLFSLLYILLLVVGLVKNVVEFLEH